MLPPRTRIQLDDIARACGVGTTTVSRVINGRSDVAIETRRQVEATIRQLGYIPSAAARYMRSRQPAARMATHTIAIIAATKTLLMTAHTEILIALMTKAAGVGYRVVVETSAARLSSDYYDGVVLLPGAADKYPADIPAVTLDWFSPNLVVAGVLPDYTTGIYVAAQTALSRNYRRPLLLTRRTTGGPQDFAAMLNSGYARALHENGFRPEDRIFGRNVYTKEIGYQAAKELLADRDRPDLIFANDDAAIGVYRAAAEAGVRIPGELGVVGCDGVSLHAYLVPALATIAIGFEALADAALSRLIPAINGSAGPYPQRLVLPTQFIDAESIRRGGARAE